MWWDWILFLVRNSTTTPEQEIKNKLKLVRADCTRVKNLAKEIDTYHKQFVAIRTQLDDEKDGLVANWDWSLKKKGEIDQILTDTKATATELDTVVTSVRAKIASLEADYGTFTTTSAKVFDTTTGFEALHKAATDLHTNITNYQKKAAVILTDARTNLTDIKTSTEKVNTAYVTFQELVEKTEDPKTGIQARLDEITKYAKDALQAKTDAEAELLSIKSYKTETESTLAEAKLDSVAIQTLHKDSEGLTDQIKDTLGKISAESLSKALRDRVKSLKRSLIVWGVLVGISAVLLAVAVGLVFYYLFVHQVDGGEAVNKLTQEPSLTAVLSKILFTSPFVFLLYFTTTNFSHVRDQRDKYAFKETVAKSLGAYTKTLRKEFEETDGGEADYYKQERHEFTLSTMKDIYKAPLPEPKKKRYNFGINRIFQVSVEDEDIRELGKRLTNDVEDYIEDKAKGVDSDTTP